MDIDRDALEAGGLSSSLRHMARVSDGLEAGLSTGVEIVVVIQNITDFEKCALVV